MWLLWHVTAAVDVSTVSVAAVTVDVAVAVQIILIIEYPYIVVLYWGPYHPRPSGAASILAKRLWRWYRVME